MNWKQKRIVEGAKLHNKILNLKPNIKTLSLTNFYCFYLSYYQWMSWNHFPLIILTLILYFHNLIRYRFHIYLTLTFLPNLLFFIKSIDSNKLIFLFSEYNWFFMLDSLLSKWIIFFILHYFSIRRFQTWIIRVMRCFAFFNKAGFSLFLILGNREVLAWLVFWFNFQCAL